MLLAGGAVVRLNDAARGDGIIVAQQHRAYDPAKTVPTLILRNDDYGRIERLLADGEDVKMEFNIVNHVYPEGKTSYNVVGEIPGSDKADEIVMLGGHLDSWHSATGATDNAIGSAIMMEAARLIQSLGLKPRRTVRVALWSGEEEGLLGSLAYVKQHFGTAENPKPEWAKLDCYFNVDTGTGRIRGAGIFGPPEAAAVLRPVLAQFTDWGVFGVSTTNSRATGGTDSTSFNNAGLPGVGFSQDPIEYNTHDPPHQSRYLRAHHPGRRAQGGGDRGGGRVARGQSRRDGSAIHQGDHARSRGSAIVVVLHDACRVGRPRPCRDCAVLSHRRDCLQCGDTRLPARLSGLSTRDGDRRKNRRARSPVSAVAMRRKRGSRTGGSPCTWMPIAASTTHWQPRREGGIDSKSVSAPPGGLRRRRVSPTSASARSS